MINSVLDGLTAALYEQFGSQYYYYVEDVKQNLMLPCFTVDVLSPLNRSRNSYMYDRTIPCVIHCFTANTITTKHELYATGELVCDAVEYITVEGRKIRGEEMSVQLAENDVLQVFVTYRFWTEKEREQYDKMERLRQNQFVPKHIH